MAARAESTAAAAEAPRPSRAEVIALGLLAGAMQRIRDICDYHSSVEQAAETAARAGVGILILTHYVPAMVAGTEDQWRALAATAFDRQIELGNDLHRVQVHPGVCTGTA